MRTQASASRDRRSRDRQSSTTPARPTAQSGYEPHRSNTEEATIKITGNTILITGGTSGIGLGLARRFHAEGNKVIIAGRRESLLDKITAEHPGMDAAVLDVSDPTKIARFAEAVIGSHRELNVVINNAGIMLPEDLTEAGHLTVAEATVATNLLGPLRLLAEFVPMLVDRADGVVMNVSSGLAFVPLPVTPTYSATKAAIHSYTQSLRVQLAGTGVQVLELIPPAVQTDLMGQNDSERAMPLEAFLDEVMDILRNRPEAVEICVDNVMFLRTAEATGRHDEILALLSGAH